MEQRDYLQKQIDQLGQVLGKILADLLGLKNQGQANSEIEITNQTLKTQLDLDIDKLANIPSDNFIDTLKSEKQFSNDNLNTLADILLLLADNLASGDNKKTMLYKKCLTIYQYLEKTEQTYSFDRHLKIEQLKTYGNNHGTS